MVSIVVFIISWDWRLVPVESNGGFCTKAKLLGQLSANTVKNIYIQYVPVMDKDKQKIGMVPLIIVRESCTRGPTATKDKHRNVPYR